MSATFGPANAVGDDEVFDGNIHKEIVMREKVERWLNFWVSKPLSWVIFGLWLVLVYTWIGVVWCAGKVREKWTAWRTQRRPDEQLANPDHVAQAAHTESPIAEPAKRASKRQAVQKE
jgi:hypothetical protein